MCLVISTAHLRTNEPSLHLSKDGDFRRQDDRRWLPWGTGSLPELQRATMEKGREVPRQTRKQKDPATTATLQTHRHAQGSSAPESPGQEDVVQGHRGPLLGHHKDKIWSPLTAQMELKTPIPSETSKAQHKLTQMWGLQELEGGMGVTGGQGRGPKGQADQTSLVCSCMAW